MKTLILITSILIASCSANEYPLFPQDQLELVITTPIPYENSLFLDPKQDGYLGDTPKKERKFKAGEIVTLKSNRQAQAIVMDYKWNGKTWMYRLAAK